MPKIKIGSKEYDLSDSQLQFLESLCNMMDGFNTMMKPFTETKNGESALPLKMPEVKVPKINIPHVDPPKINIPKGSVPYSGSSKMEEVTAPVEVPKPKTRLPYQPPTISENKSNDLVLGKNGKSYIFNREAIQKLLDDGVPKKQIAERAGVNVITMTKFINSMNSSDDQSNDNQPNDSTATKSQKQWVGSGSTEKSIKEIADSIPDSLKKGTEVCPVCGKEFFPAPQHVYKDSKGKKVCSYSCARKSGGM